MSKFPDRTKSALMVIDVQNDVVAKAWQRDAVIANINALIAGAREANVPVLWVQHSDPWMEIGSDAWEIVPELQPLVGEIVIQKKYRSSFEETELDGVLEKLGVGHLYVCGAETNNCVRHTSHAALERGYDVTLVGDAHTTTDIPRKSGTLFAKDIVAEQNGSFYEYQLPGRAAALAKTEEISFNQN